MATVPNLKDLPAPTETSVSIITNAKVSFVPPLPSFLPLLSLRPRGQVTLGLLQQAKQLNIPVLWLQPGAEDDSVKSFIHANGLEDKVIYGGPCILVEGDGIRQKSLL